MLRIFVSLLLMAFAGPAAAQMTGSLGDPSLKGPKLKPVVTVTSELVRIGDLVENAGPSAGIAIFRSPDLGYTGGLSVARVVDALAPYRLASLDTGNISEIMVTRLSRAITAKEIEARITRSLAGQYGFSDPKNIKIIFDREVRTIHVEPSAADDLQLVRVSVDQRTGRFSIVFDLPGSAAAHRIPLRFTGTAIDTLETIVLVRPLNRGEIIKASDITVERRPKSEIADEFISSESAIGFAAKRPLRPGVALRPNDLMKPEAVQRNEAVTITYEIPGVLLTARGKALESGSVGEIVGVVNIQSNRTIQATVVGPGRVTVSTATSVTSTTPASYEPSNPAPQSAE